MITADEIISKFDLEPHPEGGHFRETFRDRREVDGRSVGTAILFLLKSGERSHWHRVDATEIWHFYAGAPLELSISERGAAGKAYILANDLAKGQSPQLVVPARHWQAARSLGEWSLVGCTVSPGFEFDGFEMAPEGWEPVV